MSDLAVIRRILYHDPVWAAYAIADLQPEFNRFCTWLTGDEENDDGLALLYQGLTPPVLLTVGEPGAVDAALAQGDLPPQVYLHIRNEHEAVVQRWYDNSGDRRLMYRMVLRRALRADGSVTPGLMRLHSDDAERLWALYSWGGDFTPTAFDPRQLGDGVFFGVEDGGGDLLAVGGTHIVDWGAGIGAIGNFYTRPDRRGQGFAAALLTAIVQDLRSRAVDTIVLNVDQRNTVASRLYERHGFVVHCPFIEGMAKKRDEI
jgi:ribosomal protein S18 acetylase RimI-like enzyme